MSDVEQFPYCDRNPASGGPDLMPDLPIILRHQTHSLSAVALVDSGASISVLPYSLGVQLRFDWNTQKAEITLAGTLAHVGARGIVVEAAVGQLAPVRLAVAWADSDQVPFLLGQFNFFQSFDVCFFRTRRIFEIRQPITTSSP
jgi:aspartyl protease